MLAFGFFPWMQFSVCFLLLFSYNSGSVLGGGREDLASSWFDAAASIRTYDAEIGFTTDVSDGTQLVRVRTSKCRCRYRQGMWRLDYLEDRLVDGDGNLLESLAENEKKIYAFDGLELRFLNGPAEYGEIKKVQNIRGYQLPGPMPFELFGQLISGQQWTDILMPRLATSQVQEAEGGFPALHFPRSKLPLTLGNLNLTFGFMKSNTDLPTSIQFGKSNVFKELSIQFANESRLFPVSYSMSVYNPGDWEKKAPANLCLASIESFAVNVDIPVSIFSLEFPTGTKVTDQATNLTYLTTETGEKDYDGFRDFMLKEAGVSKSDGSREQPNKIWLLRFVVMLGPPLLAILYYLLIHKRSVKN